MRLIILAGVATLGLTASAGAHPTDTVGYCISDGLYGNEPNIVDPYAPGGPSDQEPGTVGGRVVPSQSPGPWVNNSSDPDNPTWGFKVGDFAGYLAGGALPEYCGG